MDDVAGAARAAGPPKEKESVSRKKQRIVGHLLTLARTARSLKAVGPALLVLWTAWLNPRRCQARASFPLAGPPLPRCRCRCRVRDFNDVTIVGNARFPGLGTLARHAAAWKAGCRRRKSEAEYQAGHGAEGDHGVQEL